ncbi:hypothetical protein CLAFUW4_08316 [Fulvia fulva]|uniref:Uncharacterized protein n=1 Tax=Passalora fulva TaxID=5499 RepID=A0A9Q8LDT2_PASFU|nr:uncharacterized protein CLAFUR5_08424 [Fulvia fulva]KAK4629110.1 hypothetical protein CLAFUR4_08321 [Fulvia fulva]KAK4630262.1 hypothetical protein CLAFUR0_08316 [Fulvia fulva]UJO14843.1 hypothetical protein CLAFUR5_08424 [Fulvia fulva]WPV12620.1 hypothetical protein CLAFUW4_08316 [Fulvia fulva]WPV27893.1 hypothetical protein CLAFUW7_08316 [Fulvia fulva]
MSDTTVVNAALRESNIFPFFDFPAELRDLVYDEALIVVDTNHRCLKLEGQLLVLSLLSVSKRFSDECRAHATKHTSITITEEKK